MKQPITALAALIKTETKWEEKQPYWYFKRDCAQENLKRETESILIAAEKADIRTNYFKRKSIRHSIIARIDWEKVETIHYTGRECNKLAHEEYKPRPLWEGKVINSELCKILKFTYTTIFFMHKPESVLENEPDITRWHFAKQTDRLTSARKTNVDLVNQEKTNLSSSGVCRSGRPQSENKRTWKIDIYWNVAKELKKLWNV